MKQRWVFAALSVLAFSAPAIAEPVRLAQAIEARVLQPHEILTIVRSTGLDPIGRPVRQGPNYVLHAIDEDDREMRVVVSARRGEILRMAPAETPARIPPRGGVAAGPYERMDRYEHRYERAAPAPGYIGPDGYRYGARQPVIDDDDEDLPPSRQAPRPPGNVPHNLPGAAPRPGSAPLPRTGYADPPPVIRATPPAAGGGVARGTDLPPPSGSLPPSAAGSRVVTAPPRGTAPPPQSASRDVYTPAPDHDGMLPPPPERFPQRVAPAPDKPKPVKREATAAAPKPAPVPKPRPATPANAAAPKPAAPAVAAPAATPAAAPKAEAPKAEAPKAEVAKAEASKTEAPKAEAPKTEAPKPAAAPEQKQADGAVPH